MNVSKVFARALAARVILLWAVIGSSLQAQPIITAFAPTAGAPGDTVTLYGSGFTLPNLAISFWQWNWVMFASVPSDTLMTVVVPDGITTGPINIQQITGTPNYTANDFTAIGTGPYITGFLPAFGKINDLIVINGAHLSGVGPRGVSFNGTNSTDAVANADGTQINVHVPFGATSGYLTVTTLLGTSNSPSPFVVLGPGPYITGFSPVIGTPSTTVSIYGTQFTGATNATFNGQPGLNFVVQSDTLIRVVAPNGVTSGPLTVNSPLGSSTTLSNFFVPASFVGFSPVTGRQGTNVTLSGNNFLGATGVSFNGKAAPNFVVQNNTNIVVAVPAGATTGTLRVVTPAGSVFSSSNFVVQPVISGFAPSSGPVGTSVVISGANFTNINGGTPAVKFNGVAAATPTGISFGQLTAVVPAGTTTGPISISTSDGAYTTSTSFYLPASITNFTPNTGPPGTRVTLSGRNFTGANGISFNGVAATDFTVTNSTSAGATVPSGGTTGPISIRTPAGTASTSQSFYGIPVVTDFSPQSGLPGTNVVISGSNFTGATSVDFNGTSAAFVVLTNSQIFATVPNGASSGPITVVTPGGTNTSTASFVLSYASDLSVAITGSPNPVTASSNLVYTIRVLNKGPLPAPNVRLTNTFAPYAIVESVVLPGSWTGTTNGNPIEAGVGSLAVNVPAILLVTVAPQTSGSISSTVMAGSDYPDPYPTNNTASVTTTVSPLPVVGIQASGNQAVLAWPVTLTNYVLEESSTLATNATWSLVGSTPVVSGDVNVVTVTNSGATTFYRLRK